MSFLLGAGFGMWGFVYGLRAAMIKSWGGEFKGNEGVLLKEKRTFTSLDYGFSNKVCAVWRCGSWSWWYLKDLRSGCRVLFTCEGV